jgi:hypothetical protein
MKEQKKKEIVVLDDGIDANGPLWWGCCSGAFMPFF